MTAYQATRDHLIARLRVLDYRGGLGYEAHALVKEAADTLEDAPHARDCMSHFDRFDGKATGTPCSCWKAGL